MSADALKFFCRHLIGIGWYEGPVNDDGNFSQEPIFWGASGFLLQLHEELPDFLCLITAGHVFTEYQDRTSEKNYTAKNFNIFDNWGLNSTCNHPIPFNIFESNVLPVCDDAAGRDFAIVPLPFLTLKLLKQTTVPFTKRNWVQQSNINFDYFAMLGLRNEDAGQIKGKQGNLKMVTTFQNPVLLPLEPCQLPRDIPPASNPQFIARIPNADLGSIKGMSGGPIFGFRRNPDDQLEYCPVAIQSRWLPQRRIVFGTLIPSVAEEIEQNIEMILNRTSN